MLNKTDLVAVSTIVTNAINEALRTTVKELLEANNHMLRRDIRDEIYSANKALRSEFKADMQQLRIDLRSMQTEIVSDIGDILDSSILPQITELQRDMIIVKTDIHNLKTKVGV